MALEILEKGYTILWSNGKAGLLRWNIFDNEQDFLTNTEMGWEIIGECLYK